MARVFDIAALVPAPWKNGAGLTREIVSRPLGAGSESFLWRASIASIERAAAFSSFPGVDRIIMLLAGDGVHLHTDAGTTHHLVRLHVPWAFAGDVPMHCTLAGGPSTDLNLMTRRGALRAELHVLDAPTPLPTSRRGLLLALRGVWQTPGAVRLHAGQGLWWDDEPRAGGRAIPLSADSAALAWARLEDVSA